MYRVQVGYSDQPDPEWEDSDELPKLYTSRQEALDDIDSFVEYASEQGFSYPREDFRLREIPDGGNALAS